jgi:hypothetical protein
MSSTKHSTAVIIGGVAASIGIILLVRYIRGRRKPVNNSDSNTGSEASKPLTASASTKFPITVGSRNDLVKQLQSALGVTADGIFGPLTQAALTAQTGKLTIASQAEYDAVITQLQSKGISAANRKRAEALISQWNKNTSTQLMPIAIAKASKVTEDISGALQPTGVTITLAANLKLSRADYRPLSATTNGNLKFDITRGTLAGRYTVDPNKITVV